MEEKKQEEKNKVSKDWGKTIRRVIVIFVFGFLGTFMFYISKAQAPSTASIIMWNTISIMFNILIIFVLIGTGVGIDVIKRFLNKFKYKSGNYMNSLQLMKSGVVRERFIKQDKDTKQYKINGESYIAVPQLIVNYKGIPSYFHREGNPDPLDLWDKDLTGDLANNEMDNVMNARGIFDFKEWLNKNMNLVLIALVGMIIITGIAGYFGFSVFNMLNDGTYKAVEVSCKIAPEAIKAAMLGV